MGKIKDSMADKMNAEKSEFIIMFGRWTCKVNTAYYSPSTIEDMKAEKARKAIILTDTKDNQVVATATVNMPDHPCKENQIYVKDYSENTGILQTLIDNKIVFPVPVNILGGQFVKILLMELTPEAMKLWEKKK